ncbi:hypothetical protein M433DRAFT_157743 [Acidomyces richmondensis BFW]|nr:hypothetical protein M433DRAFT_157743 [Acidomyces richmondensis BFW]
MSDVEHFAKVLGRQEDTENEGTENEGTDNDAFDMLRLGKIQVLKRNFHPGSVLGLATSVSSTWISYLTSSGFILIDGGRAGAVWMYVISWGCMGCVAASMAEMASMAPTSGGQYHWVSEFSPPAIQAPLSYVTGWLAALAWQAFVASAAFPTGSLILIAATGNGYVPAPWQGTLMMMAIGLLTFCIVGFGTHRLPLLEGVILMLFVFGFFGVLIPLWVLAPMAPAREVFTEFRNFGGWPTVGVACIVGQIASVGAFVGVDSPVHMAEEVRNASLTVPRMMMASICLNGLMGLVMIITYCFAIQDVQAQVVESTAVFPFMGVFEVAVGSRGGAIGMTVPIIILSFCICLSSMATTSRQAWSFARDNGLPFPRWFTKITRINGTPTPLNSVTASCLMTFAFALLNLGGTEVFDSIYGVGEGAALLTYAISIGCVLWRRLFGKPLPPARWSLGKLGPFFNAFSVLFLLFVFVMDFFPLATPVTAQTMNWGIAFFGGVALLSTLNYFIHARKVFKGPVVTVQDVSA